MKNSEHTRNRKSNNKPELSSFCNADCACEITATLTVNLNFSIYVYRIIIFPLFTACHSVQQYNGYECARIRRFSLILLYIHNYTYQIYVCIQKYAHTYGIFAYNLYIRITKQLKTLYTVHSPYKYLYRYVHKLSTHYQALCLCSVCVCVVLSSFLTESFI